jgi:hypothetical protein
LKEAGTRAKANTRLQGIAAHRQNGFELNFTDPPRDLGKNAREQIFTEELRNQTSISFDGHNLTQRVEAVKAKNAVEIEGRV